MSEKSTPKIVLLERLNDKWDSNRGWAHGRYDGARLATIVEDAGHLVREAATSSLGAAGRGFDDFLLTMAGRLMAWAEMREEMRWLEMTIQNNGLKIDLGLNNSFDGGSVESGNGNKPSVGTP